MPLGLPPSRPRDGANGLRSLADLADVSDQVFFALGHSLTTVEAKTTAEFLTWKDLLDDLEFSEVGPLQVTLRGTFGLLTFDVHIPRGTPAFTAYLDRGYGLAHAVTNDTSGAHA